MKNILRYCFYLLLFILTSNLSYSFMQQKEYMPKEGFIPDKETAIKIAEAVWLPIYSEEIYNYKPFNAELIKNKVWKVYGTLHSEKGGVPHIEIQKKDGKIIKVSHGK